MRVFVFLAQYESPEKACYQHGIIQLFEGAKNKEDFEFFANHDYYMQSDGTYLFKKDNTVMPEGCDYILFAKWKPNYDEIKTNKYFDIHMKTKHNYKIILIDSSDGQSHVHTLQYFNSISDVIYKTNYNDIHTRFKKYKPLVLGLSNRIIDTIDSIKDNTNELEKPDINKILYSHRICDHTFRVYTKKLYQDFVDNVSYFNDGYQKFETYNATDSLHYNQSGRRHNLQYYKELINHKVCDVSAGYAPATDVRQCYQIDSWKLWEALYTGCCVIMVDLDVLGIQFPVQPRNMVHYIGLSLDVEKDKALLKSVVNRELDVTEIAKNGNIFVNKYYKQEHMFDYVFDKFRLMYLTNSD